MTSVNIYLTFDGDCEAAFLFYKSVFGGEFPYIGRFGEMPEMDEKPILPQDVNRIMHVSLPISKETILLGSDITSDASERFIQGNNFSISVDTASKDEANRIYAALSEGGKQIMPLMDTFWGAYFGMLTDKFGINWMLNVDDQDKIK